MTVICGPDGEQITVPCGTVLGLLNQLRVMRPGDYDVSEGELRSWRVSVRLVDGETQIFAVARPGSL